MNIIVNGNDSSIQTADISIDPAEVWVTVAAEGTYDFSYVDPNKAAILDEKPTDKSSFIKNDEGKERYVLKTLGIEERKFSICPIAVCARISVVIV